MEQLLELLAQIRELADAGVTALEEALGGEGGEGGAPPEAGGPEGGPPPGAGGPPGGPPPEEA